MTRTPATLPRRRTKSTLATAALLAVSVTVFALTARPAQALSTVKIGKFVEATDVVSAPGYPDLLYVVMKTGVIDVLNKEKRVATPFLSIPEYVRDEGERGLLSMAFSPDFKTNGLFYVFYVNKKGNIQIDEFKRKGTNGLVADKASRRKVLVVSHPNASNHNGGQLKFGPDKLMYISIGDGGSTLTPGAPAVSLQSLLGKILRIDPSKQPNAPYRNPADNPFVGKAGLDSIYSYGLRNPWRFSISGNNLIIGDVGQSAREEINFRSLAVSKGANFGWPRYEGTLLHNPQAPEPTKALAPILQLNHDTACAISGGVVVTDPTLPTLLNRYIYSDYCNGDIRSFVADVKGQKAKDDKTTGLVFPSFTGFGVGGRSQVYFMARDTVYRIAP